MGCWRFLASINNTPPPRVNGRAEPAATLVKTLRLIIRDIDGGQSDAICMKRRHVTSGYPADARDGRFRSKACGPIPHPRLPTGTVTDLVPTVKV